MLQQTRQGSWFELGMVGYDTPLGSLRKHNVAAPLAAHGKSKALQSPDGISA